MTRTQRFTLSFDEIPDVETLTQQFLDFQGSAAPDDVTITYDYDIRPDVRGSGTVEIPAKVNEEYVRERAQTVVDDIEERVFDSVYRACM